MKALEFDLSCKMNEDTKINPKGLAQIYVKFECWKCNCLKFDDAHDP